MKSIFNIRLNLEKIKGSFCSKLLRNEGGEPCDYLCIPLNSLGVTVGEKGVYFNLTAIELETPKFKDTHFIKMNVSKEIRGKMNDEEKAREIPIIGGMHKIEFEVGNKERAVVENATIVEPNFDNVTVKGSEEEFGDLPF